MSPATFRTILVLSVLLGIAGGVLDIVVPGLVSTALTEAFEREPSPAFLDNFALALLVIVPVLVVGIAGPVGLFLFKRWGRALSLWSTLVGLAIYPLFGSSVSSGWANALSDASLVLWGMTLASAYGLSVRNRFEADSR